MSEVEIKPAKRRAGWLVVALVVIVGLLGVCGNLYLRYRHALRTQPGPSVQAADLSAELGKSIALPNEVVAISTVVDTTKFNDPQLATEARNGDQLLIYNKARRVILYRPSTKKVIDMFHVTVDAQNQDRK